MAKAICISVCPLKVFRSATACRLKVVSNVMDWILSMNYFSCKRILTDDARLQVLRNLSLTKRKPRYFAF